MKPKLDQFMSVRCTITLWGIVGVVTTVSYPGFLASPARAAEPESTEKSKSAPRPDPAQLSGRFDSLYRSDSSKGRMTMTVTKPEYERTLEMDILTRGLDDTRIRVVAPRKDYGVTTLKKDNDMWNYLPKVKKTIRVPPSMMMGAWMGSDFTNDDLVRSSSWEKDYYFEYDDNIAAEGELCLFYEPKPEAAVTWSKVLGCFDKETLNPIRVEFYDEKDRKARTISYDKVGDIGGRQVPRRLTVTPHLDAKKGHQTVLEFEWMEFDVSVSGSDFSLAALERGR